MSSCQNEHTRASILRSKTRVTFDDDNSTTSHSIDRQRDKIPEADGNHGSDGQRVSRPFQRAQAAELAPSIDNKAARTTRSKFRAAAELHKIAKTRNVPSQAIDNAMETQDPSRRQAAILQLLGDAEVDREGLINILKSQQADEIEDPSIALISVSDEPTSFKKALDSDRSTQWKDAIQKEYDSHILIIKLGRWSSALTGLKL